LLIDVPRCLTSAREPTLPWVGTLALIRLELTKEPGYSRLFVMAGPIHQWEYAAKDGDAIGDGSRRDEDALALKLAHQWFDARKYTRNLS
jgi:hypothetical protein